MIADNEIYKKCRESFNSICICGGNMQLVRLVGYHEDELDYYYRVVSPSGRYGEPPKTAVSSAVGWMIPLRGVLPEDDYASLEYHFNFNGVPPAKEFTESIASMEENLAMYGPNIHERYGLNKG